MRALVIGGTRFVGRHLVSALLKRHVDVTAFHRGQTGRAPEGVEEVLGDRERDLGLVASRAWDVVFDTCGYVPRVVALSARALAGAGRYVFVSTISVYPADTPPGATEDSPLVPEVSPEVEEVTGETYGGLKVACERVVRESFGDRAAIVRPGLVVGPGDYTDRFTYWAVKFATPGRFAFPDKRQGLMQHIDGRDLGAFMARLASDSHAGTFLASGPHPPCTLGELVETGVEAFGSVATPVWVPTARFVELGIEPWSEVPLVASFDESVDGLFSVDNSRAVAAGLSLRPLAETLRDTVEWWATERRGETMKAGLTHERERALLDSVNEKAPPPKQGR